MARRKESFLDVLVIFPWGDDWGQSKNEKDGS